MCRRCQLHLDDHLQSTCSICLDSLLDPVRYTTVSNESWTNKKCNHRFCHGCLRGYLRARLEEGAWNIRCPAVGCSYLWLEADIRKVAAPCALLADAEKAADKSEGHGLLQRFRSLRSEEYGAHLRAILQQQDETERSLPDAKLDPAAGDGEPFMQSGRGAAGEDMQDASVQDFGSWARQSCQACPTCLVVIRKEIGCDHMQCRCGMSFCYGCGAPFTAHGVPECLCKGQSPQAPKLARWLRNKGKLP